MEVSHVADLMDGGAAPLPALPALPAQNCHKTILDTVYSKYCPAIQYLASVRKWWLAS